jgi:hypothetical protein
MRRVGPPDPLHTGGPLSHECNIDRLCGVNLAEIARRKTVTVCNPTAMQTAA